MQLGVVALSAEDPVEILKILEDKKNPLLERRELRLLLKQDAATPSKADVEKMIAEIEKIPQDRVVVDHVYQKYGQLISMVIAKIYEKPVPKKEKKKKAEKEEKAEETPKEKKVEKAEKKPEKARISGEKEKAEEKKEVEEAKKA